MNRIHRSDTFETHKIDHSDRHKCLSYDFDILDSIPAPKGHW